MRVYTVVEDVEGIEVPSQDQHQGIRKLDTGPLFGLRLKRQASRSRSMGAVRCFGVRIASPAERGISEGAQLRRRKPKRTGPFPPRGDDR
jgi:hypothetical protein